MIKFRLKRVLSSLRGINRLAKCVGMPWQSAGLEIVTRYPKQIASSSLLAMTWFSLFYVYVFTNFNYLIDIKKIKELLKL